VQRLRNIVAFINKLFSSVYCISPIQISIQKNTALHFRRFLFFKRVERTSGYKENSIWREHFSFYFQTMRPPSDFAFFRTLVISSVLVGLIPFSKIQASNLKLNHQRFYRVWSPFIRFLNIFVFPTMFAITVLAITKVSCDYSHLNHVVFQIVGFCTILVFIAAYLFTQGFITQSLILYKLVLEYDETYWHIIHSSTREIVLKFLFFLTLLAEPTLNSYFILIRLVHLDRQKLNYTGIDVIDVVISSTWIKVMYALCTMLINYHVIYTLFSISLFSNMIQTRMCQIRETLTVRSLRSPITARGVRNLKLNSSKSNVHVHNLFTEIQHLHDIFLFFKDTIKWMLLLFMSHITIVLPMLLYYGRTSFVVYGINSPFIPVAVMVDIVVTLVKTISLTNSGQRILDEVSEMDWR